MLLEILGGVASAYVAAAALATRQRDLSSSPYPSPDAAIEEIRQLARRHAAIADIESIGLSTEGRPIEALRLRGESQGDAQRRPALLITAQIHAIEYIGSYVARAVATRLASGYGKVRHITDLLDATDIWIVPLLNPDGAHRIWRNGGWTLLSGSRFTAQGVDPNRNFPFVEVAGAKSWNSGRDKPGSPYYRGPRPLSEPECMALAKLCKRERFCAAINFHSFSAVVFMPSLDGGGPTWPDATKAARALSVFRDVFQSYQSHRRYRPIPERSAAIVGQLDPFLLNAFGTVSVTVEVSRPGPEILLPWRLPRFFAWANPRNPEQWVANDAEATIFALAALLERTGGAPCIPPCPDLAERVP